MKTPRSTSPRRWGPSALTATLSVTLAAMPALAYSPRAISLPKPDMLWLAAGTEGGESGEAGVTAEASDDAAYLAELAIVQGHYLAAHDLWEQGHKDLAIDLAGHPEEEGSLAAVSEKVLAKGATSPAAAVTAFRAALGGDDRAAITVALTEVEAAFSAAAAVEASETRARFDAVVLLLKAAAEEYEGATAGGKVTDSMGWYEAFDFVFLARTELEALSKVDLSAKAAPRALEALKAADEAFTTPETAADPAILLGVAAKVELLASSVR